MSLAALQPSQDPCHHLGQIRPGQHDASTSLFHLLEMSLHEDARPETIARPSSGHSYQGIRICGGNNHLGDTYHVNTDDPLSQLPNAVDALFNSYTRQHEDACLPNTRVDLLREIYAWADGIDERCVFWLRGLAGTGKSTIARTVARKYYDERRLGASFFFSRGHGDVSHAAKFVTSIAFQVASAIPACRQYICNAIIERKDISSQSLRDQWEQLVLRPLLQLKKISSPSSYVLVVDALDECNDDNNIRIIVQLLAKVQQLNEIRLRVFLTSRPEIPIRSSFSRIPEEQHQIFILHNISPPIIDHDISLFLEHNLKLIREEDCLDADWPGAETIGTLVQTASGLFIWAATACKFLREGPFPDDRLRMLVEHDVAAIPSTPEGHLDQIYTTVLQASVPARCDVREKKGFYTLLRDILGTVVALLSPLTIRALSVILDIPKERVEIVLKGLHAILNIPQDSSLPVRLHHPSFRDFLLSEERCHDPELRVDEKKVHRDLFVHCIELMLASLKQDICGTNATDMLVSEVGPDQIERHLPSEVQYACLYWVQHLQKGETQLSDGDRCHRFLQEHFLDWLESLSWMQSLSAGIHAIIALETLSSVSALRINMNTAKLLIREPTVRAYLRSFTTRSDFLSTTDQ